MFCDIEGMGNRNLHQVRQRIKIQKLGFELLWAILALETALPFKENIPVKDFCNLTESLIL